MPVVTKFNARLHAGWDSRIHVSLARYLRFARRIAGGPSGGFRGASAVAACQAPRKLGLKSFGLTVVWSDRLTPIHIGRSVRFAVQQLEQFVSDRIGNSA